MAGTNSNIEKIKKSKKLSDSDYQYKKKGKQSHSGGKRRY